MVSMTTTQLCPLQQKSRHRRHENEWEWLCANKTLFPTRASTPRWAHGLRLPIPVPLHPLKRLWSKIGILLLATRFSFQSNRLKMLLSLVSGSICKQLLTITARSVRYTTSGACFLPANVHSAFTEEEPARDPDPVYARHVFTKMPVQEYSWQNKVRSQS